MSYSQTEADKTSTIPLGIIEGFFGKEWSWNDRLQYPKFLALHGFDFYIYAPKGDEHLRRRWRFDWPVEQKMHLENLSGNSHDAGIKFGIGLSPYEIYLGSSRNQYQLLEQRVRQINEVCPDVLCILFDDMRGDLPGLAQIQIDVAHLAADISTAKRIIFCPTYYSFDPVLERVFGAMPENYWQCFSKHLDPCIDIFWTGEKVCSTDYPHTHLETIANLLGRKPFLWDNYPVNDGAVKSNLLQLNAVSKSHGLLEDKVAGHALNPMNQAWLSRIPLASLPIAYRQQEAYDADKAFLQICTALCGKEFAYALQSDLEKFQRIGLQNMSDQLKYELLEKYKRFSDSPYALEIIDWVSGKYVFDPSCLT